MGTGGIRNSMRTTLQRSDNLSRGYLVLGEGFEPPVFALRERIYSPSRNHRLRRPSVVEYRQEDMWALHPPYHLNTNRLFPVSLLSVGKIVSQ